MGVILTFLWNLLFIYLPTDTFSVIVIERKFILLPVGKHLLPLITVNRHLLRSSNRNLVFTSSFGNVSIVRHDASLVIIPIPILKFVTIH